jgi:hypothetical protein
VEMGTLISLEFTLYHFTLLNEFMRSRTQLARALSTSGAAGTLAADLYTFKMVSASAESMHAAQRNKSVYRPGRTNTQISRRTAPLWMACLHFRQHARPVGARDMR